MEIILWECPRCFMPNFPNDQSCDFCGEPRPKEEDLKPMTDGNEDDPIFNRPEATGK